MLLGYWVALPGPLLRGTHSPKLPHVCSLPSLKSDLAVLAFTHISLTALFWNWNLKSPVYIFLSLPFFVFKIKSEMLADELSWEGAVCAYPVLWVLWPDGSCSKAWGIDTQHSCQVTKRSSSILIRFFIQRTNLFKGKSKINSQITAITVIFLPK